MESDQLVDGEAVPEIRGSMEEIMAEYGRLTFIVSKQNRMIVARDRRIAQLEAELEETIAARDAAIEQVTRLTTRPREVAPTKRTSSRKPKEA